MRNVQSRSIDAPAATVGALLDRLASADDPIWPARSWPPLVLDVGLTPGSRGGHGPIRYSVADYEPGRRIRFRFDAGLGIVGYHELLVAADGPARCRLTHTVNGRTEGRFRLLWPLAVRWLHEALIKDLFARVDVVATGQAGDMPRWSWWVRTMRRTLAPGPRLVGLPAGAHLARSTLDEVDVLDAWQLPVGGGTAEAWTAAIFDHSPGWLGSLLRLRNRLARLVGLDRAEPTAVFTPLAADDQEVLLGGANRDFALRISVYVTPDSVTCTTLTRARTRRGRAYLRFIRYLHPVVVRAMLRRALAVRTSPVPGASAA
jgi:hypothetical protein